MGTMEKAQTPVIQKMFHRGLPHLTKYPQRLISRRAVLFLLTPHLPPHLRASSWPEKSFKSNVSSKHYRKENSALQKKQNHFW